MARAFKGEVQRNPQGWEVGPVSITLTPEGKASSLFHNMPETFSVIQSHRDIVTHLPSQAVLLAKGEQNLNQAFQIGKTAFGVQFHPEMNRSLLNFLWAPRLAEEQTKSSFNISERIKQTPNISPNREIMLNFVRNFT